MVDDEVSESDEVGSSVVVGVELDVGGSVDVDGGDVGVGGVESWEVVGVSGGGGGSGGRGRVAVPVDSGGDDDRSWSSSELVDVVDEVVVVDSSLVLGPVDSDDDRGPLDSGGGSTGGADPDTGVLVLVETPGAWIVMFGPAAWYWLLPRTIAATVAKPVATTIPAPARTTSRQDWASVSSCGIASMGVHSVGFLGRTRPEDGSGSAASYRV
ncbi:hypothetical protein FHX42_000569 [Saccharopolyspora lacisalsi]|uniref:Uncharacterized protein n=1 Tax=Halosaccharopolyspora lacisalsi TaxID=1000566 RepID=A0A839DQJ3_9PSEU|nr:hypothetical protein [Halosaccharopolyspora lacisalsi]MBA8823240.1 hypothetical protein [Halosaccharopolyspora lacisalsi]